MLLKLETTQSSAVMAAKTTAKTALAIASKSFEENETYGLSSLLPPRLSLNGTASISVQNSQSIRISPQSSKSHDAIYSQDISTITSYDRQQSQYHYNIDEYCVTSNHNDIMGKTE